jgi:dTDP-4-dehydrorhamnose 3,5-epimerase
MGMTGRGPAPEPGPGRDSGLAFRALPIPGAFAVSARRIEDERGWFARSWSTADLAAHGLTAVMAQSSVSYNGRAGTLRGLHYQVAPAAEAKLVTCIRGRIWDVLVDLRRDSPAFRTWYAEELDADGTTALYLPEGLAHGFLTLTDDATILYQISADHDPARSRGVRWDDPTLAIAWPSAPVVMSERDRTLPELAGALASETSSDSG